MEKEIKIDMISHFQGETLPLRRQLTARYRLAEREAKLIYKQQLDPEEKQYTPEILKVAITAEGAPQKVQMKRPGTRFQLNFEPDSICTAIYDTPAGAIEAELHTQQMDGRFSDGEVYLHLQYELRLGSESMGVTTLIIRNI